MNKLDLIAALKKEYRGRPLDYWLTTDKGIMGTSMISCVSGSWGRI